MSIENKEIIITSSIAPEVAKKMESWALMGQHLHNLIPQLQAGMQSITATLIPTPTVEQIPEAEAKLAEAKRQFAAHKENRIKTTSKFDAVIQACMAPEKTGLEAINAASAGLLKAKQELATQQAQVKAKEDELKRIREAIANLITQKDAAYLVKIEQAVTLAFEAALKGLCPDEASVPAYLDGLKQSGIMNGDMPESFMWMRPPVKPVYNTDEDVNAIWAEMSDRINTPEHYRAIWASKLDEKFAFYGVALKHKEQSIQAAKEQELAALSAIQDQKIANEQAAKMEAVASTFTAPATTNMGRSLKYDWEIQMPDTPESAILIMTAFVANVDKCRGGVRVKSWGKLGVDQMSAALCWYKKQDEAFGVTGINFIKKDKL